MIISPSLPLPDATPELARRFAAILLGIMGVVAKRFVRQPWLVALNMPLWNWLNKTGQRFARAVARAPRNGRLAADTTPAPAPSHTERGQRVRLPAQRGWLLKILGWEVALYSNLLEQMLAEPDMQALIAARPGLGRWLRPLCRMLHVSAPVIARAPVVKPETLARRMERRRARRAALWPTHVLPVLAKGAWFAPPIKNSG